MYSAKKLSKKTGLPFARIHFGRRSKLLVFYMCAAVFLFFFAGTALAYAPTITKTVEHVLAMVYPTPQPVPIRQDSTVLSANTQQAIEVLARQEIQAEQAQANFAGGTTLPQAVSSALPATPTSLSQAQSSSSPLQFLQTAVTTIQDAVQYIITTNPVDKEQLRLKKIDQLVNKLTTLLATDQSDQAITQATQLIQQIAAQRAIVTSDPTVQSDRTILTAVIEQYMRTQLVLQKLEDQLPMAAYLKIDDAREKYLVQPVAPILSSDPHLATSIAIGDTVISAKVGSEFKELKDIEVLTDLEQNIAPEKRTILTGLEKELAIQFEKKMLKLPRDVRARKLQDYIQYSYGNPLLQIESFDRMREFLSDRSMIFGVESLKELALQKLEDRVFELKTPEQLNQFLDRVLQNSSDLRVLTQMQLDINAGRDQNRKQQLGQMMQKVEGRVAQFFGKEQLANVPQYFASAGNGIGQNTDLLDVVLIRNVDDIVNKSPDVSQKAKETIHTLSTQTLATFVQNVAQKDFLTKTSNAYNPVSPHADVRLLLSTPVSLSLLQNLRDQLPAPDKKKLDIAIKSQASLIQEHLLLHVSDPSVFSDAHFFITQNPPVQTLLQKYTNKNFLPALAQKQVVIDKIAQQQQQHLYEKMQHIVQRIFTTPQNQLSPLAQQLPADVQQNLRDLKQKLPAHSVPKLDTPAGVMLPPIAKLSDTVEAAIITAAKQQLADQHQSRTQKLNSVVQAKTLGVSDPHILPGDFLYPLKETVQKISLALTLDPLARAQKILTQDNQKILEVAKLIAQHQDRGTVDLTRATLTHVTQDIARLKQETTQLETLKKAQPQQVDHLVDTLVQDTLARQTVLTAIEQKTTGDDFVQIEKTRQEIVQNTVGTVLDLTNHDITQFATKLETAIANTTNNTTSELKELPAVELLTEIARTQPPEVQHVLVQTEQQLVQKVETEVLSLPVEQRASAVVDAVTTATANPVTQFAVADVLQDNFTNTQTISLVEHLKDTAVENLTDRVTELTDATAKQEFVDEVIGNQPQDLKIVLAVEQRVTPPVSAVVEETLPIVQEVEEIKSTVIENIIDTYKNDTTLLAQTNTEISTTAKTDILDVKVAQELTAALSASPEVTPAMIEVAQQTETKTLDNFLATISTQNFENLTSAQSVQTSVPTDVSANISVTADQTLSPTPQVIEQLVELKQEVSVENQAKIDAAIRVEVNLLEQQVTAQISDPVTAQIVQTEIAQIQDNPVIAQTVAEVGGPQLVQQIAQQAQTVATEVVQQNTQLQTEVTQVEQHIFTAPANNPTSIEQTLTPTVQAEIQQVKQEVPVSQVPTITVEVAANVPTVQTPMVQPAVIVPEPPSVPVVAPIIAPAPAVAPVVVPIVEPAAPAPAVLVAPAPAAPAPVSVPDVPAAPKAPSL